MRCRNKYIGRFKLYITFILLIPFTIHTAKSQPVNNTGKKDVNLLIIHSFEETLPDYKDFNRLVEENLKEKNVTATVRAFYLDCDAYGPADELDRLNNYLDSITTKPDIILVVDDQATYSLLASHNPTVKTVPIVFSGVNYPNWELLKQYPNVTGILDSPDYEKNIGMIEKLLGTKRVRFFYDKTYNGKKTIARLAEQYKEKDKELHQLLTDFLAKDNLIGDKVEGYAVEDFLRGNDYTERPQKTSIDFINMWDERGRNLLWNISGSFKYSVFLIARYDYSTANVGRLATVPTFSAVNKGFTYNQDILGGYFTPLADQIKATSDYLYRIIEGEKIAQLPPKELPKKYVVDWAVLDRWGITVNQVPKEFEIVNMPFFVRYKTEAIILLSLIIIFTVSLIVYLLFLYRREAARKRQAQMNLWEEKEFLSLAMEGSNIFAWRFSNRSHEFAFDKEFADSVGISSQVVVLEKMNGMTHPNDQEYAQTTLLNVVNGVVDRADVRVRVDFNGKGYVWYEFRFLNVSGVLGEDASVIGLVMNIQDFKNKEQELIEARDMASKAELKQSFLANMSHEIRTPLNAIVGFSNILVSDDELSNEEKLDYIRIINKNCELLLKLINDILDIARIESGNISLTLEPCDLNDVVKDVYNMCLLQTPANVAFRKTMLSKPFYLDTDVVRLKQVLVNFISNAFKFTTSGSVSIGIELDEKKKEVSLYVEDTGVGIPEDHQKMIFDRFYKVDEFVQGTGLGLSICQVIVTKLNGRIGLSSEVGKGSSFVVVLPYANELKEAKDKNTVDAKPKNDEIKKENQPVVLIAEDSVNNYMILNNMLKKSCNILWAVNGKDALEILRKQKVDLVLMDIKMDEMDGITALTKLRKNFKKLPVIIQTAYAYDENRKLAKQAGASGFIAKPITPDTLMDAVTDFINIDVDK